MGDQLQLTSDKLPRASKHCGGYIYSRETHCLLNGVATPVERIFSKGARDRATPAIQISLYLDAPVGSVLEVTNFLDSDQVVSGYETDDTSSYVKIDHDCWALLA